LSPRNQSLKTRRGKTNKCFVKQELCLYPFPHFSHFNSLPLLIRPIFPTAPSAPAPSLARLLRAPRLTSGACPSAIALPLRSAVPFFLSCWMPSLVAAALLRGPGFGRLLGGLGYPLSPSLLSTPPSWSFPRPAAPPPASPTPTAVEDS
jgi:hypothetical protein